MQYNSTRLCALQSNYLPLRQCMYIEINVALLLDVPTSGDAEHYYTNTTEQRK